MPVLVCDDGRDGIDVSEEDGGYGDGDGGSVMAVVVVIMMTVVVRMAGLMMVAGLTPEAVACRTDERLTVFHKPVLPC